MLRLLPDPYTYRNTNPENVVIESKDVEKIFKKMGIEKKINNIEFYKQAFIHESYVKPTEKNILETEPLAENEYNEEFVKWPALANESYDRQEFLGDRVIDLIIADYIVNRYPNENEGFLTELKTKIVRGSRLCILAKKLKLYKFVQLSPDASRFRKDNDVLEDVFEAFIGAIYKDFGRHGEAYGICKDFLIKLLERYLNFSHIVNRKDNYKKILGEYYHEHFKMDIKFKTVSIYGPTNNRIFKSSVLNIDGFPISTGEGYKSIEAEQMAAKEALKYYGETVFSDSDEPIKEVYTDSESEEN
jgi:ribonuclease III